MSHMKRFDIYIKNTNKYVTSGSGNAPLLSFFRFVDGSVHKLLLQILYQLIRSMFPPLTVLVAVFTVPQF